MYSDMLHFWYSKELILKPTFPWEFVQLGNCGSPIETEAGWLVLSHGVGPMRKYSIGAFLARFRKSRQSHRPHGRTVAGAQRKRARRICAQCRLQLRRGAARPRTHHSVCDGRLRQFIRHGLCR